MLYCFVLRRSAEGANLAEQLSTFKKCPLTVVSCSNIKAQLPVAEILSKLLKIHGQCGQDGEGVKSLNVLQLLIGKIRNLQVSIVAIKILFN